MNIEHLVIPIHRAPDMSGMSPSKVYPKRILPGGEPADGWKTGDNIYLTEKLCILNVFDKYM